MAPALTTAASAELDQAFEVRWWRSQCRSCGCLGWRLIEVCVMNGILLNIAGNSGVWVVVLGSCY